MDTYSSQLEEVEAKLAAIEKQIEKLETNAHSSTPPIVILGAGLAGSCLACFLGKKGYKVELYEFREDMRKVDISAGKSINLAISARGLKALKAVGLEEEVKKIMIPMYGRMLHSPKGDLTFQSYSKDGKDAINSIGRGELNVLLMNLAEKLGVKIFFNHRADAINLRSGEVTFEVLQGSETGGAIKPTFVGSPNHGIGSATGKYKKVKGCAVMGCDGSHSIARQSMLRLPKFDYSQSYITTGYKELHIPPTSTNQHKMEKHALHIWPRGKFMMIALPNLDGSYTVTCFFPFEGEHGFDRLDHAADADLFKFFKEYFPDAIELMPDLIHDFKSHPTAALVTVRCFPWSVGNTLCLFGDAAHAIVPFFGQGMNASLEDTEVFNTILEKSLETTGKLDWGLVFREYERSRKNNTESIADMALENLVEMSAKTADPKFLFKKQVEGLLGKNFPQFQSRYEMVSFSTIPYSEAVRIGEINDKITEELMKDAKDISQIDLVKAKKLVESLLTAKL